MNFVTMTTLFNSSQ